MRLRGNNLRKVLNGILDYYKDVIGLQIPREFPLPDVNRVVEGNTEQVGRLLQLILGVAINCPNKEEYIQNIMVMEETVQQVIMKAIQEVLMTQLPSLPLVEDDAQVKKMMEEMEKTRIEKEHLAQKCHELEMRLNMLQEEKSNLSAEFEN